MLKFSCLEQHTYYHLKYIPHNGLFHTLFYLFNAVNLRNMVYHLLQFSR